MQRQPLRAVCTEPPPLLRRRRGLFSYFIPRSLPSFLCRPALVVGIPVAFEIFLFIFVIPSARFQLKDRPGILLFDIWHTTFYFCIFSRTFVQ
nr:MAG TPA: hypothetical protein [Caudoviricetes sp.]